MRHVWSAAPATQNGDGGLQSAAPATKTATHLVKTTQKYCACHAKRLSTRYQTGWNVTVPRLPRKTTWQPAWKPSKQDRFCSFPHRHGEATGKPETRDETRWSIKTSISCVDFLQFSYFVASKSTSSKSMFCARLPSIFITSHKMLRLATEFAPCRHLTQPWQCDSQKTRNTTRLKWCACHAKWRWRSSKVLRLPRKLQLILLKTTQKYCACHAKRLSTRYQNRSGMSRSATPATRNEATRRFKPPKITPFAELTIGTPIRGSRRRLRTVADGCERLRNVERTHPQPPGPQSETGTLATHSGIIVSSL